MLSARVGIFACAFLFANAAQAEMQKLSEVAWWAAYGGNDIDGKFKCAMVTALPAGGGQFVIEHVVGADVLTLRFLKSTWTIEPGSAKEVDVRFGYGRSWPVAAFGAGTEVRGQIALSDAAEFLAGFQGAGRIDVTFVGGSEPMWELATGGGGIVEPDFRRCVRMNIPPVVTPPTQP